MPFHQLSSMLSTSSPFSCLRKTAQISLGFLLLLLNVLLPRPPLMDNPPKPEQYVVDAQVQSYSPPSIFSFHPVSIWPFLLTCISSITINVNYISVMLLLRSLNHIGKYRYLLDGFNSMSQRYFKLNISKTNFNIHNIPTANLTFIQHFPISLLPLPVCTSQKIMFQLNTICLTPQFTREYFSLYLLNISQLILLLYLHQYHSKFSYHDFFLDHSNHLLTDFPIAN